MTELGFKKAEITKLNRIGVDSVEALQEIFPRKYVDLTSQKSLVPENDGVDALVIGRCDGYSMEYNNGRSEIRIKVYDSITGNKLNVLWLGMYQERSRIESLSGKTVAAGGVLKYNPAYGSYHMFNPLVFTDKTDSCKKVLPVYTKFKGVSDEWLKNAIGKALMAGREDDIPEVLREKYGVVSMMDALNYLHHPKSLAQVSTGKKRVVFGKVYSFAYGMEKEASAVSKGSQYNIKSTAAAREVKALLPYSLTESQNRAVAEMTEAAYDGRRINALVQGDVGSGKTAVAMMMMLQMAGSGYQAVLMAPTEVLAKQHYKKISAYAEQVGIRSVCLCGGMNTKEKKEALKQIKSGESSIIIGTHSAISDSVEYNNLALAVIDEEHKFGVDQEQKLVEKAGVGVHTIYMSATPIPRTIAETIFAGSMSIYDLEPPAGRQEIQTAIFNNDAKIYEFIRSQVSLGRQCYVVCPIITDSESERMSEVLSVETVYANYCEYFAQYPEVSIACVTGRTDRDIADKTLSSFSKGQVDILIATSIVEVGVDNPNATVIVINSAERFGVAQLHQLRGRVGRGQYRSYCILKSSDHDNERLNLLCSTTDGYRLAEEDMRIRGAGDLLGTMQSGSVETTQYAMTYPNLCKSLREDIREKGLL